MLRMSEKILILGVTQLSDNCLILEDTPLCTAQSYFIKNQQINF